MHLDRRLACHRWGEIDRALMFEDDIYRQLLSDSAKQHVPEEVHCRGFEFDVLSLNAYII